MEEKKKQVLNKWLEMDMINIAKKMGLSGKSCDANSELLMDTIRCLDYESIVVEKPSVNYIITVIGLMWEHVDHTKFDLRKFIIKILSRIGYPTSAIICDKDFDKENGTFSGLDSWIDEVALTINQMKNEIIVANQKYLLTDYQKQIWDSMDNDKVLGISAPTSAGKSFVILLKLVDRLINDNIDIVYIVPTLSLLNQVTEDFNRELKKVGVTDYWISNSFDEQQISDKKNIYIMTQEKAIAAFSDTEKAFTKRLILVADEIQNIERIREDKDQRSKILFDTLIEFRYKDNVEQIIISGPRIKRNIKKDKKMKVKLEDIIEAMEFADMETEYYYDTKNERILMLFDGMVDGEDNPELFEDIKEGFVEDYIPLPGQYDINEYQIMEEFIYELPAGKNQDVLAGAIQGRGAFRRFKDKLYDLNLQKQWYQYRDEAYEKIARQWCERHKIDLVE